MKGYTDGATEQKANDDAELARLKEAWEKEAELTHNDRANYQQGWHDAIDRVCEWYKNRGCHFVYSCDAIDDLRKTTGE